VIPHPTRWRHALAAGTISALCLLGTARALRPPTPHPLPVEVRTRTLRLQQAARATLPAIPPHTPLLLLRHDCPACHTLVRTLARRARLRPPPTPLAVVVDHPWPDLLTLAANGTASLHPTTTVRNLPITPALAAPTRGDATSSTPTPAIRFGIPDIIGALDTLHATGRQP